MASEYRPAETLLHLHKSRRSGILRFQKDTSKKQIVLAEGRVVFAESNAAEEHLARVMVSTGLLKRPDLVQIASIMKKGKTSEEAVIGVVGNHGELLHEARHAQAVRIMASLLESRGCDMRFYSGTDLFKDRLSLDLSIPELLLESARIAASRRLAAASLAMESLAPETGLDAGQFALNDTELLAYDLISRQTHPADRISMFPPGKDVLEQSLSVLAILGLIRTASPVAAAPGQDETGLLIQQLEDMFSRIDRSDAYEILSVSADAETSEIQAAYHELARRFHPDHFQPDKFPPEIYGKAERVFTAIKEAYQKLKDAKSRAAYSGYAKEQKPGAAATALTSDSAQEAESLFRLGRGLMARGEFERAAAHLNTAAWLCPEKAAYHLYLGVAEAASPNSRKSAERHLLKAVELDFTSVAGRMALAKLYLEAGLNRKAEQVLKQVLDIDSENEEARKLLRVDAASRRVR